jgi:hypothetical protein
MFTKQILGALTAAVLTFAGIGVATAHHSAAQFDFRNTTTISGTVKFVRFANPHGKLILEVTDDERGTRDIEYESHSRNNMVRQGLLPEMFLVGDDITINIAPMRDGKDGGYVTGLLTEDGRTVGQITAAD